MSSNQTKTGKHGGFSAPKVWGMAFVIALFGVVSMAIAAVSSFSIGSATKSSVKYTKTQSVVLYNPTTIDAGVIDTMAFSNETDDLGSATGTTWDATYPWTLASGDGVKTVNARYTSGGVTADFSDTVILDTVAPTCSIKINGGKPGTRAASVTLTLLSTDDTSGVSKMRLSKNGKWTGWRAYKKTVKKWGIPKKQGTATVSAKFMDRAGNVSEKCSDTIVRDTLKPSTKTFAPKNVKFKKGAANIKVSWKVFGEKKGASKAKNYDVQMKVDGDDWTNWQTNTTSRKATYTAGSKGNTYSFRSRTTDSAGNTGSWSKVVKTTVK